MSVDGPKPEIPHEKDVLVEEAIDLGESIEVLTDRIFRLPDTEQASMMKKMHDELERLEEQTGEEGKVVDIVARRRMRGLKAILNILDDTYGLG